MSKKPTADNLVAVLTDYERRIRDLEMNSTQGLGGSSDAAVTWVQASASVVWIVTHDLNKYPSVIVVDDNNEQIIPDIDYINDSEIHITFGRETSGKAYLN